MASDFTNFTLTVINVNDAPIIITNDLEIIQITPDVEIVVFAEETKSNAVYKDEIRETRDYTIYEYTRK